MAEIKTRYGKATYDDSPEAREAVFQRVMDYFKKYESLSGECIMQSDDPQIYAPEVFADIADGILKFVETEE
jgi:hypothetical protein